MTSTSLSLINIEELIERVNAIDTDLLIIQDNNDTKKITLQNLVLSILKDDELPGIDRIYSSQKIMDLFDELKGSVNSTPPGIGEDVEKLKKYKLDIKEFEEVIKDIEKRKIEIKDLESISGTLAGKRDTNVPIKSSDLDTSDDEYKIKLANLSEEVLDAMIGDSPVALPQVPEGGWLSRHIANRSIISTKLHDCYRYKGLITDMSVNNIIADGIYLLGPDVKTLPKYDRHDTNLRLLEVTRFGENGKYIKQEIDYYDNSDMRPKYVRKGVCSMIHTVPFTEIWDLSGDYKVDSHLLGDDYSNRGVVSSGNIFDVEIEGSYYILPGVTGTPNTELDYSLSVSKHNNTLVYTLIDTTKDYCLMYIAEKFLLSNGLPEIKGWHQINKLNKSKFDGKKLVIFGDGISYGIGASRLSTTSYAALLKNNYGFVVQNNALGDATAGNYDDLILQNRSLTTQISSASLSDTCKYGIIFIGTNDWRLARGRIGKINDYGDTTFYGAMNKAMSSLIQYCPTMKILLVTPLYRARQDYDDNKNSDDYQVNYTYLKEYGEAIKKIGEKYHMPVLDLYNNCCINKYNSSYYLEDGLHPNDEGHALISEQIYNAMNLYF